MRKISGVLEITDAGILYFVAEGRKGAFLRISGLPIDTATRVNPELPACQIDVRAVAGATFVASPVNRVVSNDCTCSAQDRAEHRPHTTGCPALRISGNF